MTAAPQSTPVDSTTDESAEARPMRVEHRGGDKFDIDVRGHVVRVDQPFRDRGEDTVLNTLTAEPDVSITFG